VHLGLALVGFPSCSGIMIRDPRPVERERWGVFKAVVGGGFPTRVRLPDRSPAFGGVVLRVGGGCFFAPEGTIAAVGFSAQLSPRSLSGGFSCVHAVATVTAGNCSPVSPFYGTPFGRWILALGARRGVRYGVWAGQGGYYTISFLGARGGGEGAGGFIPMYQFNLHPQPRRWG